MSSTWLQRVDLYSGLPGARDMLSETAWKESLRKGMDLEKQTRFALGFEFETSGAAYGFHRRASDATLQARHARLVAEVALPEPQDPA